MQVTEEQVAAQDSLEMPIQPPVSQQPHQRPTAQALYTGSVPTHFQDGFGEQSAFMLTLIGTVIQGRPNAATHRRGVMELTLQSLATHGPEPLNKPGHSPSGLDCQSQWT